MRVVSYLSAAVFYRTAGSLALLLLVYAAIDIVESFSLSTDSTLEVVVRYPFKLPLAGAHLMPIALLLGVLLALAALQRRGEWDAFQASGISPVKLASSMLVVPGVCALASTLLVNELAPAGLAIWSSGFQTPQQDLRQESEWFRDKNALVRRTGDEDAFLSITKNENGRPVSWSKVDGFKRMWTLDLGWRKDASNPLSSVGSDRSGKAAGSVKVGALPGSVLTDCELKKAIDAADRLGQNAAPLRSEQALRRALTASCLILPALGLGLGLLRKELRLTVLLAKGLAAAALYWLCLAVAWNGAFTGLWSISWVWVGVPAGFAAIGFAILARSLSLPIGR